MLCFARFNRAFSSYCFSDFILIAIIGLCHCRQLIDLINVSTFAILVSRAYSLDWHCQFYTFNTCGGCALIVYNRVLFIVPYLLETYIYLFLGVGVDIVIIVFIFLLFSL